jgi:hypothetical protein
LEVKRRPKWLSEWLDNHFRGKKEAKMVIEVIG